MDYLTCIHSFQMIISEGSFIKAAKRLHTTQSTMSKRIDWLELRLHTKLLERTTRELNLTEQGKTFLTYSHELLSLWQNMQATLRLESAEPSGSLQIAASSTSGEYFVLPLIDVFLQQYPKVKINYAVHNHTLNLTQDQLDLYITTHFMPTTKLIARETLTVLTSHIIASPAYLKRHGSPKSITDLNNHNCLIYIFGNEPNVWQFSNGKAVNVDGNFESNTLQSVIQTALKGVGLAFIPSVFVRNELEQKQLKIILPANHSTQYKLYAYYQRRADQKSLTKTYLRFIKEFYLNF